MKLEKSLKIGIIGVGSIAQCHARGFLKDGRAKIVNVCDLLEEEAANKAKKWGADLIVLGSHGYRGLQRFLLGSVSHAVVAHAPCSVEIVRKREAITSEDK